MAEEQKTRIINLAEKTAPDSGDFFAVDSQAGGSKKIPATALAKAADLTAEAAARTQVDNALTGAIESASALIQNPTKTLSGALVSFTDGADMPMVACTASIVPKQSGSGTPSPSNVRAISGWESVDVNVVGKNFVKLPNATNTNTGVTITCTDEPTITFNGTRSGSATIVTLLTFTLPSGTYILSGAENGDSCGLQLFNVTQNSSYRDTNGQGVSFTVNGGDELRWRAYIGANATMSNATRYPLLRLATETDSTYTPYNGHTTTTPLGRTVYGGTLDVVSGVLTVDRAMVDLGTLTWTASTNDWFFANTPSASVDTSTNGDTNALCENYDRFNVGSVSSITDQPDKTFVVNSSRFSSAKKLVVKDSDYSDGSAFKTAMNGVKLVYELATPQTIQLTPEEVKTLLGENNVWADSGDVEITYRRDISIVLENLENAING